MSDENKEKFQILFVDNSRTTRATMAKILEKKGYSVDTAGTGVEAIDKAKTGNYEIIVMDLFMPMMNGYEAAKKIRDLTGDEFEDIKKIPIIALTASSADKDADISRENGMNDFVVKSSDHEDLFEAISKYI